MREMSDAERREFLTTGTRTGKLATVRADGSPHVVPIWFVLDGDSLVFTVDAASVKAKALRRDPRVSVCVDDEVPPYAFVLVEGTAAILDEDAEEKLHWTTRIGGRYMGADRAEEFGRRNAVPSELLVRLPPTRLVARVAIAD